MSISKKEKLKKLNEIIRKAAGAAMAALVVLCASCQGGKGGSGAAGHYVEVIDEETYAREAAAARAADTGNREPETGNRESGTGGPESEPGIGNRESETGNRESETGGPESGTGNRGLETGGGSDGGNGDEKEVERVSVNGVGGPLWEVFNDSNHYQMEHARRLGIRPIETQRDYYHNIRPLVKVETCRDFVVDTLTHSHPYLVPEGSRLLHDIGKGFQAAMAKRGVKGYRIIVTSLLRSKQSVKKLRRVNVNATEQSTHQYGTTFDITYTRFAADAGVKPVHDGDMKNVLAEVLEELRKDGRCMVKYERKTPCFHITVAR